MDVGLDHPAVAAYLARLDGAAAGLPPGRREELMAEIRGHVRDSLAAAEDPDDATVLQVLDRLGDPESIVAAEVIDTVPTAVPAAPPGVAPAYGPGVAPAAYGPGVPARPEAGWGPLEILAVAALTAGNFLLPIIGPLIGIVCAWFSPRWTRGEKAIATALTFLLAVALMLGALSFIAIGSTSRSGGSVPVPVVTVTAATPVPSPTPTLTPGGTP